MSPRRKFTPEFKARVALELLSGRRSSAELCRQHEISATLLAQWKDVLLQRASLVFAGEEQRSQEAARIAELEQLVGRLTLEAEIAKKAAGLLSGTSPARRSGSGRS